MSISTARFTTKMEGNGITLKEARLTCFRKPPASNPTKGTAMSHQITIADEYKAERDEFEMECIRLREELKLAREALEKANDLRPALLNQLHYVPECVLWYCNQARAALERMKP